MTHRFAYLVLAVSFLVLTTSEARATRIIFEFDAVVTKDWYPGVTSAVASVGDTFTGRFSYDSDAAPGIRNSYNLLFYTQDISEFGVEITLGLPGSFDGPTFVRQYGYKVAVSDGSAQLLAGTDVFHVQVNSENFPPGAWPAGPRVLFQLTLHDTTGSAFSSDALPSALNLADFDKKQLRLRNGVLDSNEPEWILDSEITRLQIIPEPGSATLVAIGLTVLSAASTRTRLRS